MNKYDLALMISLVERGMASMTTQVTGTFFLFEIDVLLSRNGRPVQESERGQRDTSEPLCFVSRTRKVRITGTWDHLQKEASTLP